MVVVDGSAVGDVPAAADAVVCQHRPAGQWAAVTLGEFTPVAVIHHVPRESFHLPGIGGKEVFKRPKNIQCPGRRSHLFARSGVLAVEQRKFHTLGRVEPP